MPSRAVVRPATVEDASVVAELIERNQRELHGTGPTGRYPFLDRYWTEPDRRAHLVVVDGQPVGVALVNRHTVLPANAEAGAWSIAELYVVPEARAGGLGTEVARHVLAQHPGPWEVCVLRSNRSGLAFWTHVLAGVAGVERVDGIGVGWDGDVFSFAAHP